MKKRILSLLLAMLMVVTLVPTAALAEDDVVAYAVTGGNIYFNKSTGEITGCDFDVTEAVIPSEIEGVAVTSIPDSAFAFSCALTSITIPNSLTYISDRTLENIQCGSRCPLKSITVEEDNSSYSSDSGVLFNNDKTELLLYPRCKTNTSYVIPDNVVTVSKYAFNGCKNLESIVVPKSVINIVVGEFISEGQFSECSTLESIIVEESNPVYSSIGGVLFNKDKTVLIEYPSGKAGESYAIPDGVTDIGYAFAGNSQLKSITIPESITGLDLGAFIECTSLESINIPESVTRIGGSARENADCQTTPQCVFSGCSSLKMINVAEGNPAYASADGVLFNKERTKLLIYPAGKTDASYIIPDSVTSIEYGAFSGCTSLTDVYYTGTEEQWNEINIEGDNEALLNATIHYNYHEHVTELRNAVEPTCTETGYTGDEVCSVCNEVISQGETIEATGHHYKGSTCTICGHTRSTADTIRAWFRDTASTVKNFFDKIFGRI